MRGWMSLLCVLAVVPALAHGDGGTLPYSTYAEDQLYAHISPTMGEGFAQNQPSVVNGYLLLAGNAHFEIWDIADPFAPVQLSTFESEHDISEAESHQVATRKTADGRWQVATISGVGIDLWDVTDPEAPALLAAVPLEGIDYGDNSEAVWGVAWQGDTVWVGGTNTGLHVLDVSEVTAPQLITRVPISEFGDISAGPLWALGDLLIVTTPKDRGGIVTFDISEPSSPAVLDFEVTEDSYIGGFYRGQLHQLSPLRTWEVLEDPTDIRLLGSVETPTTEYIAFGDGRAFVGRLRPNPGVLEVGLDDPTVYDEIAYFEGRRDDIAQVYFTDDQFTMPIGNLVVLGDDETRYGAILVVRDLLPDSEPPRVSAIRPRDGATGVSVTARVGVSLTDQVDLRSVTPETLIVRPVLGGEPVSGDWDLTHTVLGFSPHQPLSENTAYEVVLPAGGVSDLSGNGLAAEARAVFTTGTGELPPSCGVTTDGPVVVGQQATLTADDAAGVRWSWDFGDGVSTAQIGEASVTHAWSDPGRWSVTLTVHGKTGARSCTGVQVVHRPLLDTAPAVAGPIAVDEAEGRAFVVNPDAGTLTAVDVDAGAVLWEVGVGKEPTSVAQAGDILAVALRGEDALVFLDANGVVSGRTELGWGASPWAVALRDGFAWVTLEGASAVVAVALEDGQVRERVDLPPDPDGRPLRPRGLAVHPDGRVFVSRFLSAADEGEVLILRQGVTQGLPLAIDPGPDEDDSGRGVPNLLAHLALSPDGERLAVPSTKANVGRGLARDGEPLNPQNTVRAIVSFMDLDGTGAERMDLRQDLDDHDSPWAATWSPSGDLLFVVSRGTNRVDVLDVDGRRQLAGFATGLAPTGVALLGTMLLVHDSLDRTLTMLDVTGLLAGTDAAAERLGVVSLVADDGLDPTLLRGKQIFTNASTRQMSQDGYLSCATCHPDGGSDERVWDFTDRGEGLRNTIDLRGRGGVEHGAIHWSGNFDEIQDFENDIRAHFGGSGFMATEDFMAGRSTPLGEPKAGVSPDLDALAAYVASLREYPRSPFREADGSLTEDGNAGRRIFERLDCVECHSGEHLTDSALGVRHDVGTLTGTSGGRLGGELDGIDTPTLHGLHASAPYLHDGSAPTLEATLRIEGHGDAQKLDRRQMEQLVSYLLQLDGSRDEPTSGCACHVIQEEPGLAWVIGPLALGAGLRRRRSAE